MSSRQAIKKRIKSVKNTKQITKAMELVAASKLRKAQEEALAPLKFTNEIDNLLEGSSLSQESLNSPFFRSNSSENTLTVIISSDKGLAGAYNNNVLKELFRHFNKLSDKRHKVISVGRYASLFMAKLNQLDNEGVNQIDEISAFMLGSNDYYGRLILPISREITNLFISSEIDEVYIVYTNFKSTIKQQVVTSRLLPIKTKKENYLLNIDRKVIEPNTESVINYLANMYIEGHLTKNILNAIASEHSSRMMAMKNATDNASDLIQDLTLVFNNARQSAITQELAEISAGAQAIT